MDQHDPAALATARRFGVAIREARLRRGLSQATIAEDCLLAQSTISRLETGTLRGMRYGTLMRVLVALDVAAVHLEARPRGWYAELMARYDPEGHDA